MNVPTQITDNFDNAAESFVDANERMLDTVVSVNRRVVDTAVELNDRMSDRIPSVELPLTDKLPTTADAGDRYIDFVERAVSMNRDFTARLVATLPTGVATTAKTKATKAAK